MDLLFKNKKIKNKRRKKKRENIFCECLVEGRGGKKTSRARQFSSWAYQNFLSPNWGKTRENKNGQTWKKDQKLLTRLELAHFFLFKNGPTYGLPVSCRAT